MRKMEQPREPRFYPNEQQSIFACGKENNTLQSIDSTLKRIEKLIIQCQNQSCNSEHKTQEDTVNSSLQRIKGYAKEYFQSSQIREEGE